MNKIRLKHILKGILKLFLAATTMLSMFMLFLGVHTILISLGVVYTTYSSIAWFFIYSLASLNISLGVSNLSSK